MKKYWVGGRICNVVAWHRPANWNPPGVPGAKDDVFIGPGVTVLFGDSVSEFQPITIKSMNIAQPPPRRWMRRAWKLIWRWVKGG